MVHVKKCPCEYGRGRPSTEFYIDGKPQIYCYGWYDKMYDEPLEICKACADFVGSAQYDLDVINAQRKMYSLKYDDGDHLSTYSFKKRKNEFDDGWEMPNIKIQLKGKEIIARADTVVLLADESKKCDEHCHAVLLGHGPGRRATNHPIILLYNGEDEEVLDIVAEQAISRSAVALEEFPYPLDLRFYHIFKNGEYTDERVKWTTC